ncbi:S8 family peptidase [Blastococcus sp. MG754426]|nr:S8 family peptidase [Blastococcus sp. MG754426]MCF6510508.1 S8 family peptidase [Blastococcus sp. MG754427]
MFKIRATRTRLSEDMLTARGISPLGETADYTYFVLTHDEGAQLTQALTSYAAQGADRLGAKGPAATLFDRIDAIEPYGPEDRRGPGIDDALESPTHSVVDVSVWPSDDHEEARRRAEIVTAVVQAAQGQVMTSSVSQRRTVLRVRVGTTGLVDLLNTSVVERVRTPPMPYVDPSDWRHVEADDLTVTNISGAAVGVLDDAPATGHPLLKGLIASVSEVGPDGHAWEPQGHHGTQVVGRVLFPWLHDELRDHTALTAVGQVHVARVLEPVPGDGIATQFAGGDEGEPPYLVIERAIRSLHEEHGVRVFNLSFGLREPFEASHVGELTEVLDDLARELDIVIVLPTGNAPVYNNAEMQGGQHADRDYPSYLREAEHRLTEPGLAALALTVGSIAHSDAPEERMPPRIADKAIAEVGHLSPFSRTGPGVGTNRARVNKPDLVHEGGNWVLTDMNQVVREDPGVGVVSTALDASGRLFRAGCGTSFAAPAVARCAADVLHAYPEASANLVRALLGASAVEPAGAAAHQDLIERRRLYGAGRPDGIGATTSGASAVTMTFDGDLAVDTVAIHPLPIPEPFASGKSHSRRIRVALAFDPPVRRQRREYLAGTMQMDLYRAIDIEELAELVAKQDPDDPTPPISDRRRVKDLGPGVDSVRSSTLQVRSWAPKLLKVDDGDNYYLVVTHRTQTWSRTDDAAVRQRYALAATLEDRGRVGLDLYALVTQQVRVPARVRLRT